MPRLFALCLLAFPGLAPGVCAAQESTSDRTAAAPDRQLDHGMLRSVYFDLLGRPPFLEEIEQWIGKGQRELLDSLLGKKPFWSAWYEQQLFHFLLIDNFAPRSERVVQLPSALAEGRLDVREALHRICLSSSFELRNPGADTFVTVVLEQLVGMKVQANVRELEIGKTVYDGGEGLFLGRLGSSQSDVVRIAIESKDFAREFVAREYRRLVRVDPTRKEIALWSRALNKEPRCYLQLVRGWMLSKAYRARLADRVELPNRLFVKTLYVDLLDRVPSPEEEEPLREALDGLSDSGPLRSIVARLLLDSGTVPLPARESLEDPSEWTRDTFLRLLGRPCSAEELAVFTEALADPACKTTTVIYALISHPDYQTY